MASRPIEAGLLERLAHHLESVGRVAYAVGDRCGEDLAAKLILWMEQERPGPPYVSMGGKLRDRCRDMLK